MRPTLGIAILLCATAVVPAATAHAAPLVREHYDVTFSDTFTDTECGPSITVDWTGHFTGRFMLKQGRRGDPTPYYFDNYSSTETFTNTANGETGTIVHQGLYKDVKVERVEGTIYKFTAIEVGRPWTAYGPDGERLVFDAGRIRYTFYVDTHGDSDLENDDFIMDEPPSIAGPHPVFVDEVTFCDFLDLIR